jgi:hypothetical protein
LAWPWLGSVWLGIVHEGTLADGICEQQKAVQAAVIVALAAAVAVRVGMAEAIAVARVGTGGQEHTEGGRNRRRGRDGGGDSRCPRQVAGVAGMAGMAGMAGVAAVGACCRRAASHKEGCRLRDRYARCMWRCEL